LWESCLLVSAPSFVQKQDSHIFYSRLICHIDSTSATITSLQYNNDTGIYTEKVKEKQQQTNKNKLKIQKSSRKGKIYHVIYPLKNKYIS